MFHHKHLSFERLLVILEVETKVQRVSGRRIDNPAASCCEPERRVEYTQDRGPGTRVVITVNRNSDVVNIHRYIVKGYAGGSSTQCSIRKLEWRSRCYRRKHEVYRNR